MIRFISLCSILVFFCLVPQLTWAADTNKIFNLHLTTSPAGVTCVLTFFLAYTLVMSEEFIQLRKSKPVVLAAGIIWFIVALTANMQGSGEAISTAVRHNILEYAELSLFLLVAMTYISAMEERNLFEALQNWLTCKGFTYHQIFWITGILAFFISPIADNLTTALVMCAVVIAVGASNSRFVSLSCINIVVAANSGGAFSPFGDITTLMVWQNNILSAPQFLHIFVPSVVSFLVPSTIMYYFIPKGQPKKIACAVKLKRGGIPIVILFLLTIVTSVSFHQFLHLPPVLGMMTGLGYLQFYSYFLKRSGITRRNNDANNDLGPVFNFFHRVKQVEWDTLFFFYGVMLCVGGLATLGYLALISDITYHGWGANLSPAYSATPANIAMGVFSAIVDNIPVMFSVLAMRPEMSEGQWLLATLTIGVGGSLLSIGSAAGVALMGQSRGKYTFFGHLKWTWAIALGYIAAIIVHLWMNARFF